MNRFLWMPCGVLVWVALADILESYDHLKLSPSEDSLREFVQVFKDRADEVCCGRVMCFL